jgi:hypothetical protein
MTVQHQCTDVSHVGNLIFHNKTIVGCPPSKRSGHPGKRWQRADPTKMRRLRAKDLLIGTPEALPPVGSGREVHGETSRRSALVRNGAGKLIRAPQ